MLINSVALSEAFVDVHSFLDMGNHVCENVDNNMLNTENFSYVTHKFITNISHLFLVVLLCSSYL